MKHQRVNITLTKELHELAKAHALASHATDFSGLVAKLLLEDMRSTKPITTLAQADKKKVAH